jgi:predicted AlkP superfamily pyrophosphatase or phosphodiesterase
MEPVFSRRSFSGLALAGLGASVLRAQSRRRLLVVSIDGLDHRYLRDADKLGLKVPNLRRLVRAGSWADGVVGVYPTVTWPSHTTLVTGVTPEVHGILSNNQPGTSQRYWYSSLLKAPTLWDACRKAGLTSAAVHWPVTVGAPIDYNLPEYFTRRRGGGMDFAGMEEKATPGLVDKITVKYPSFPQEWVDDRVRALATMYLMEHERPDLTLLHFVDHDAAAHDNGPFTRYANAILEYTDELLGGILAVTPKDVVVAIVSDHGFERVEQSADLALDGVETTGFIAVASTAEAAGKLRELARRGESGVGREIPPAEWRRYAPSRLHDAAAAFESLPHYEFGKEPPARARGAHGHWPRRENFRASYVVWGPGVKHERLPEIEMTAIASRFAAILGLQFPGR